MSAINQVWGSDDERVSKLREKIAPVLQEIYPDSELTNVETHVSVSDNQLVVMFCLLPKGK